MDAESRVIHPTFGLGTIVEIVFTAGGNLPAAKVSFDSGPERVLLLSVLTLSEIPGPAPAKKPRRKTAKAAAPVQEEVLDDKLLIELPDYTQQTAIHIDEVNIEEEPIEEAVTQDVK